MSYIKRDHVETDVFFENYSNLDPKIRERIENEMREIIANPFGNSFTLTGNLKGKRKKRIGDIRITFAYCKECRENGHECFNMCVDCDKLNNEIIKFFDVNWRGKIYKKKK